MRRSHAENEVLLSWQGTLLMEADWGAKSLLDAQTLAPRLWNDPPGATFCQSCTAAMGLQHGRPQVFQVSTILYDVL